MTASPPPPQAVSQGEASHAALVGARGALKTAQSALMWYQNEWPDVLDGNDAETNTPITAALTYIELALAQPPAPTEVRMLTREETHAVLAQLGPLSAGEFKGMDCVQMTWHRFNACMAAVQRAAFKASGLTVKEPT